MKRLLLTLYLVVSLLVVGRIWNAVAADSGGGAGVVAVCPPGTVNGNVNGDSQLDISDPVYLLNFLFSGGPDPCAMAGGGIPNELESLRLVSSNGDPGILYFGPTDLCSISVDKSTPSLILRDVAGVRLLSASPELDPVLKFGPTDDCSIGIDRKFNPGLILRDPSGVRILTPPNPAGAGPTLRFGPTDDCTIGIDAAVKGFMIRDAAGARLLSPSLDSDPVLRFGPTDDCSIGIEKFNPGLILRDPHGVRVVSPDPTTGPALRFGPTDDCSIGIDPAFPGIVIEDPSGVTLASPNPDTDPVLSFRKGFPTDPNDICAIGIDRKFPGLILRDPQGIRALSPDPEGPTRLIFGPTDDCTIGIEPELTGLLLRDPSGVRILSSSTMNPMRLLFGPTDDCSIGIEPGTQGLRFRDPGGFLFNGAVFAQAFIQTSSRKLKEDIKPIERPLEILKKLRGVSFRWNEDLGGKKDVGFIAEEVAEALPLAVAPAAADGSPGVNYGNLVAVAVEGIKDQGEKIEALEKENGALRAKLTGLEAQLSALAQQVSQLTPGNAPQQDG